MGRVGRRLTGAIKAATGERIVAFGRAGKSPENPFLRRFSSALPGPARLLKTSGIPQRLFKPDGVDR
jgi:hypothetical protein